MRKRNISYIEIFSQLIALSPDHAYFPSILGKSRATLKGYLGTKYLKLINHNKFIKKIELLGVARMVKYML